MPKAVHRSGCHGHTTARHLPLDHCNLQRQMGVNNLPKVVMRQRDGWESNLQPLSCESDTPTTRLPTKPQTQITGYFSMFVMCCYRPRAACIATSRPSVDFEVGVEDTVCELLTASS